jgi:hypothetical protein
MFLEGFTKNWKSARKTTAPMEFGLPSEGKSIL